MEVGRRFKMTKKTKLFLWLHTYFTDLGQWFIKHCDYMEEENTVK